MEQERREHQRRDFGGTSAVVVPSLKELRERATKDFGATAAAKLDDVSIRAYFQTREWQRLQERK